MGYETIIYEKKNTVAKITLNRPEALNAITRTMFLEIGQALDDAEKDSNIRVVVLAGSGKSFCAGVDLKFSQAELLTLQDKQDFFRLGNKMAAEKMEGLSKPVIAAIQGYCLAGVFELMLGADLVIAAEKITPEAINFMAMYARGLICLSLDPEIIDQLKLPLMVYDNQTPFIL